MTERACAVAGSGERPALLVATMSLVALTVAVLQTAVVPILGVMARQLDASLIDVSWVVTANLLAATSATPLIGRLADLSRKKPVLLGVLAAVLAGSVLAATTTSLPLLIAARVLQGASFSLYPIGVSILREELPPERLMRALAVLSGVLGFGGGNTVRLPGRWVWVNAAARITRDLHDDKMTLMLERLSFWCPVKVNGQSVKKAEFQFGDQITIGRRLVVVLEGEVTI